MKNILIYRNNSLWAALKDDLLFNASYCGGGIGIGPSKPEAEVKVQVFAEGASVAEIEAWVDTHRDEIAASHRVYLDNTTMEATIKMGCPPGRNQRREIDLLLGSAADRAFEGRSPAEVYRKVFKKLFETAGVARIQIVMDALTDYNPLALAGFENSDVRYDLAKLTAYAEEFKKLMPSEVVVEFVRISELTLPDMDTLVIVHHHALNTRADVAGDFHKCPRVLMSYPHGMIKRAGELCDLAEVVPQDLLEEMRKCLRKNAY